MTTTTVTGLTAGQTYFFVVTAYAGAIESGYSNEVSVAIPGGTDTTAPWVTISTPTSATTYSTGTTPVTVGDSCAFKGAI